MLLEIERLTEKNLSTKRQYENLVADMKKFRKKLDKLKTKFERKPINRQIDKLQKEMFSLRQYRAGIKASIYYLIDMSTEYYKEPSKQDQMANYRYQCRFQINEITKIKGYGLLLKNGWYHPTHNPTGCVKDHMFSVKNGFDEKINPAIVGHQANCEFLLFSDNAKKGKYSSIQLKKLLDKIQEF